MVLDEDAVIDLLENAWVWTGIAPFGNERKLSTKVVFGGN